MRAAFGAWRYTRAVAWEARFAAARLFRSGALLRNSYLRWHGAIGARRAAERSLLVLTSSFRSWLLYTRTERLARECHGSNRTARPPHPRARSRARQAVPAAAGEARQPRRGSRACASSRPAHG
eukprot:6086936-Prymnesium_polylepis.3